MPITAGGVGLLAASTTASVTPPHPGSLLTNDILLAGLYSFAGNTPAPPIGLGWSLIQSGLNTGHLSAWWRKFTSGDTAGAFTGGGTSGFYGAMHAFRGVDTVTPIDVTTPAATTGTTVTATAPNITTATAGAFAVSLYANNDNGSDFGFAGPTNGFTLGYGGVPYASNSGSDAALGETYREIASPGAVGINQLTVDDDYSFGRVIWVALTLALRPAGAVTVDTKQFFLASV